MTVRQVRCLVIAVIVSGWAATTIAASGVAPGITADDALQKLMAGNKRFVDAQTMNRALTIKATREELVRGQKPYAIILSCSDSRVPPEIVFDETLGQLFVVRVAGNVADPVVLGSIEYAVEHLGAPLIMVLGHEACGAVTAAFDAAGKAGGNVEAIIDLIIPAVQKVKNTMKGKSRAEQVEAAIDSNIDLVAGNLTIQSALIKDYVDRGKLKIVKGKYHLRRGEVTLLR
ncbi:MAG: carbonic anhydrase [Syntrophorhabdales bacterium]|jgi:carbonic anhydrase